MFVFRLARAEEAARIFELYVSRVAWMDEKGIRQWNVTGYLEAYPEDYYCEACRNGRFFVLEDGSGRLCGAVVLLREDERWDRLPVKQAWYVHNLVTAVGSSGAGKSILREAERLAGTQGMQAVRLDCAEDNEALNAWYEEQGYLPAGTCTDGPYHGVLREKIL